MAVSYQEALEQLTAPGAPFATSQMEVDGVTYTVFDRAAGTLRDLFATARQNADQVYLVYEDERWTFGDVMAQVDGIAKVLVERYGVQKGDRVAIGMRNYPEWITSFAAITSIGAISVSLNAWWTEDELDYALGDSTPKVLIADQERVERGQRSCRERGIAILGVRMKDDVPEGVDRLEDVIDPGATMPEVDVSPLDDATILYTSGTTGSPKGAASTHLAILNALAGFGCRSVAQIITGGDTGGVAGGNPADALPPVFILTVPLFHVTGCVPVMLSTFAAGLKLVIMYRWNPERALELIEREKVTNFVGVPTMSWDLLESPDFEKRDTSSLRSVGGGGAPAPPELVRRIDAGFKKARPGIGYGMTETNAYGPQNSGDDYVSHPTSTGRSTPILEIKIVDEEGREVPIGERGEISFKGPNLIRGYWNNPDATAETIQDGWLRTGDIGRVDEDGFVYIEDRAKDMVLRAGENIYCAEVEAVLYEHPAVYEVAVFGIPDERLGEQVAAAIYRRPGHDVTVEELQAHVRERLAAFKVPTHVELVEATLPRNASGKIQKRAIRDEIVART
ncbi:MAG: acyl--CoA ligase [Actinomycetota bacterium]|nr:acyl--CoA ligase [Actinomycetota bacterium]